LVLDEVVHAGPMATSPSATMELSATRSPNSYG
jgi:hypothetical protein